MAFILASRRERGRGLPALETLAERWRDHHAIADGVMHHRLLVWGIEQWVEVYRHVRIGIVRTRVSLLSDHDTYPHRGPWIAAD